MHASTRIPRSTRQAAQPADRGVASAGASLPVLPPRRGSPTREGRQGTRSRASPASRAGACARRRYPVPVTLPAWLRPGRLRPDGCGCGRVERQRVRGRCGPGRRRCRCWTYCAVLASRWPRHSGTRCRRASAQNLSDVRLHTGEAACASAAAVGARAYRTEHALHARPHMGNADRLDPVTRRNRATQA
jgi:Domain of unknown function (DUF4157)